jgi:hypothetical protein
MDEWEDCLEMETEEVNEEHSAYLMECQIVRKLLSTFEPVSFALISL